MPGREPPSDRIIVVCFRLELFQRLPSLFCSALKFLAKYSFPRQRTLSISTYFTISRYLYLYIPVQLPTLFKYFITQTFFTVRFFWFTSVCWHSFSFDSWFGQSRRGVYTNTREPLCCFLSICHVSQIRLSRFLRKAKRIGFHSLNPSLRQLRPSSASHPTYERPAARAIRISAGNICLGSSPASSARR